MNGTDKTIGDFKGWEDSSQQHDFFGETNLEADVIQITPKEGEEKSEEKKKEEEEEAKILEDQFKDFSSVDNEEEDESEDENLKSKDKPSKVSTANSKQTLEFLKEKGLVEFELEEGEELTEELAENLLEDSWENALDSAVEDTIKELPQEVKDLIKFASKGGDVNEFLSNLTQNASTGVTKNSDISKESVQIAAITLDLKKQGYDQEYIDSQIDFLKGSDKLQNIAEKAYNKIIAEQEKESSDKIASLKEAQENRKKQARIYKGNITTHINSLAEVKGLPLTKKDKAELPDYISEPTVELQDGRYVSELQADIFKVMADKDKIVLLAKILKTDFDFSPIERKQQTAVSRDFKSKVENTEKLKTGNSEGVHKPSKKAIWDMIE